MVEKIVLNTEEDYLRVKAGIDAGKKSGNVLRSMMQALENYRQSKKYGWSRPWNKYDTVTFQSFVLNDSDSDLRKAALELIECEFPAIPEESLAFIKGLLMDGKPAMGFVFIQEFNDNGQLFEGAVLSYGRISAANRRFRDRFDIILESQVVDDTSKGLSRIRVYVDPYREDDKAPLWQAVVENPQGLVSFRLFNQLADYSWQWAEDKKRLWSHWIIDYIDYFGSRSGLVKHSFFHTDAPESRLLNTSKR